MSQLGPFMGGMGGGGGGAQVSGGAQEAKKEEKKVEEVKVEKTHFDVELTSFDAANKIKVIKEIRAIKGLGLKEAKELVEAAPQWIGKELPKEEAEQLIEKMTAAGAVLKMV